jgi:hypothetical protein
MSARVHIFRTKRSGQGTEGVLTAGDFFCFTLELPWKDNQPDISCIPPGQYPVKPRLSPRFGEVYHVTEVENRSFILIHPGNFAGDTALGYRTNVQGCILLGKYRGVLGTQRAVLNSRPSVREFMQYMAREPFDLTIHEAF